MCKAEIFFCVSKARKTFAVANGYPLYKHFQNRLYICHPHRQNGGKLNRDQASTCREQVTEQKKLGLLERLVIMVIGKNLERLKQESLLYYWDFWTNERIENLFWNIWSLLFGAYMADAGSCIKCTINLILNHAVWTLNTLRIM